MTVSGPGVARMRVQAGQFVWRFLDGPGWTRGHPYSVSAAPDGRSLRLTAAHLGDGSARLAALRPGTRVLVEGPYGRLHDGVRGRRKVLLLGAGIGIAPLRALLEALPQQPGDVTIVQPAGSREQLLLAEETSALAAARGARQVVVERHRLVTLCERAEHSTVGLFSATAGSGGRRVYDPTGLVKGWAVEGAARHLALASGIAFCVNAGGDILAGTSRGAPGPRAVAHRRRGPRRRTRIAATVELVDGAVATSGSAARGAHIRDPRTGERVVRDGSATVTGPSLLWADVWATAAFVDPAAALQALRRVDAAYRGLVL